MGLQLPKQSMPITTKVESSNLAHGELYTVQHYVIKFVSDLRKVSGFLKFPPPNMLSLSIKEFAIFSNGSHLEWRAGQ
jgi:hypothetical protein